MLQILPAQDKDKSRQITVTLLMINYLNHDSMKMARITIKFIMGSQLNLQHRAIQRRSFDLRRGLPFGPDGAASAQICGRPASVFRHNRQWRVATE